MPLTVADCLSLPDETYISLPGVMVDRLDENSQYLVVKDPWSVGEDTGHYFYRLNAQTGETEPDQFPPNPFFPNESGINYFVGSAALTSAGNVIVGNDNGRVYNLDVNNLDLLGRFDTSSLSSLYDFVCSSPAISYSSEAGYKWIYFITRSDNGRQDGKGTIYAFRKYIN